MLNPDAVAVPTQLDALTNERLRGAIEVAGVLEIAVQRHPRSSAPGSVKRDRRQRPEQVTFVGQALGEDVVAGRVATGQRDPIAPVSEDPIELAQRR